MLDPLLSNGEEQQRAELESPLFLSWQIGFLMPPDHLALSGSRSYFSFLMDGLKAPRWCRLVLLQKSFLLGSIFYLGVSFRNRHMWGQGANSEILVGSQWKDPWQYQKQHVHSWPGVPSSFWGTGSGSCQHVYPAENQGDHKMWPYLPKKWTCLYFPNLNSGRCSCFPACGCPLIAVSHRLCYTAGIQMLIESLALL